MSPGIDAFTLSSMLATPFHLSFLIPIACLCHLSDVMLCLSSSTCPQAHFPEIILIIVSSILQGGQTCCLFVGWNFCCRFLFRNVSRSSEALFSYFFFHHCLFDVVCFQNSNHCNFPFLLAYWFFVDLAVLFSLFFVFFRFSLWPRHIFLCQILFIYPAYISSLLASESLILV